MCSLTEVQRTRFIWPMMEYTFINLTTSVILTTTLLHSLNAFLPITNTFQIAPTISSVSHRNRDGKVCAVLRQQLVVNAREATPEEIKAEFERIGFYAEDNGEYFTNGIHDIFDAVPNNVLVGDDGNYYFIDTIIFKSDTDGLDTYKKYSPNYSKKE